MVHEQGRCRFYNPTLSTFQTSDAEHARHCYHTTPPKPTRPEQLPPSLPLTITTMQILTLAILAAAFAGRTLAKCRQLQHEPRYQDAGQCNLKQDNVYYCGVKGTTVVHKQGQLMVRAGSVDSIVRITCNGQIFLYFCPARESERFREPNCKGTVYEVESATVQGSPPN